MSENKKLNANELDSVAGGMGNVNLGGAKSGGDMIVEDRTQTKIDIGTGGSYVGGNDRSEHVYGDKVGGDKHDTDVDVDVDLDIDVKKSLF